MALHDLVNLSCDYLLNTNKQTNKQTKKKTEHGCQRLLPLTCSVCSSSRLPVGGKDGIPLC